MGERREAADETRPRMESLLREMADALLNNTPAMSVAMVVCYASEQPDGSVGTTQIGIMSNPSDMPTGLRHIVLERTAETFPQLLASTAARIAGANAPTTTVLQ